MGNVGIAVASVIRMLLCLWMVLYYLRCLTWRYCREVAIDPRIFWWVRVLLVPSASVVIRSVVLVGLTMMNEAVASVMLLCQR